MSRKIGVMILIVMMVISNIPLVFAKDYNTATVESVTGTVSILKAGGEKSITPEKGTILEHGDRIITGKGASLSLKIDDDKFIKVDEKSYLSLSELISSATEGTDTGIKLFAGKIWASITRPLKKDDSFTIETPTAVMGAKGTKFVVKYTISKKSEEDEDNSGGNDSDKYEGTSEILVLEGTVSLQNDEMKQRDAEILIHKDERAAFTDEMMAEMAKEIENAIESGTPLEEIDFQEMASKNETLKQIEPEDLDMFTLEAIEESPDGINEDYMEQMDKLKEDKAKEEAEEEQNEQEPNNQGASYDDEVIAPIIGGDDGADDENDTPDNQPAQPEGFRLLSAEIIDIAQYNNEPFDAIKLTFSEDVDDAKYNQQQVASPIRVYDKDGNTSDLVINSENMMGVDDFGDTPNLDIANDNIIYISLTPNVTYDDNPDIVNYRHPEAKIEISQGAVVAMDGTAYDVSGMFTCSEKLPVSIKSISYTLANNIEPQSDIMSDKNIMILFTENVQSSGTTPASEIVSNMKFVTNETDLSDGFDAVNSSQFDFSNCESQWLIDENDEIYGLGIRDLPAELVTNLPNLLNSENSNLSAIFNSNVVLKDYGNNTTHIGYFSEEYSSLISYPVFSQGTDSVPASLIAFNGRRDPSDSKKVTLDLYFNDFITTYIDENTRSTTVSNFETMLKKEDDGHELYANRLFSFISDIDDDIIPTYSVVDVDVNPDYFNKIINNGVKVELTLTLSNALPDNSKLDLPYGSDFSIEVDNLNYIGDLYGTTIQMNPDLHQEYYLSDLDDQYKIVEQAELLSAKFIDRNADNMYEILQLQFDKDFKEGVFYREASFIVIDGLAGSFAYQSISKDETCSKCCNIVLDYTDASENSHSGIPSEDITNAGTINVELQYKHLISFDAYSTIYNKATENPITIDYEN